MRSLYESIMNNTDIAKRSSDIYASALAARIRQYLSDNCKSEDISVEAEGTNIFIDIIDRYDGGCFDVNSFVSGGGIQFLADIMKSNKNVNVYYIVHKNSDNDTYLSLKCWEKVSISELESLFKLFDNPKWHWCDEDHNELKGKIKVFMDWGPFGCAPEGDYKKISDWFKAHSTVRLVVNPGTYESGTKEISNLEGDFSYGGICPSVTYELKNCKIGTLEIGRSHPHYDLGPAYPEGSTKAEKIVIHAHDQSLLSRMGCLFKGIDVKSYQGCGYNSHGGQRTVDKILESEFEVVKKNIAEWGNPDIEIWIGRNKTFKYILKEWRGKYILKKV